MAGRSLIRAPEEYSSTDEQRFRRQLESIILEVEQRIKDIDTGKSRNLVLQLNSRTVGRPMVGVVRYG